MPAARPHLRIAVASIAVACLACGRSAAQDPARAAVGTTTASGASHASGGSGAAGACDEQAMDDPIHVSAAEQRPLTDADVALYLRVMRAAHARWAHLPPADSAALATARAAEAGTGSPDLLLRNPDAMSRALDLRTDMDGIVGKELGVDMSCYHVVRQRIENVVPAVEAVGDGGGAGDATSTLPPAQRAAAALRAKLFSRDSAFLAPRRAEIQPLVREMRMAHLR